MKIYSFNKGREEVYSNNQFNLDNNMQNGMFTIDWTNVKSALVSTILMAIVSGGVYVLGLGDVFKIDVHSLVNILAMSLLTGLVSLIKNFLTTNDGKFANVTQTN